MGPAVQPRSLFEARPKTLVSLPLTLQAPGLLVNACSPGFCRTEIAGPDAVYTARQPKDAALGADVVLKLLFGELGSGTGLFYKECSKPGTPLEAAHSAVEPWW